MELVGLDVPPRNPYVGAYQRRSISSIRHHPPLFVLRNLHGD